MSQAVPPPPSSPEHPFSSEKQTAPLTFMPLVNDEYMLDLDEFPTAPLPAMPKVSYRVQKQRPSRRFPALLVTILLLALAGTGSGSALIYLGKLPTNAPALPMIVGHFRFLSSDQLSETANQGICDEVQIDLDHLAPPAPGKRYYAWLLQDADQSEASAMLLGVLSINHGATHLFYPGDAQHTNRLTTMSRLVVTEEDAAVTPINPSPDESTWRDVGEFTQKPVASSGASPGTRQLSYLDHLRHLLASDPLLDEPGLPGGLITWLYRNTGQEMEWSMSMREHWEENKDVGFLRRQTARILAYLDGMSYVQQDLPPDTPLIINERLARIGLLDVQGPTQNPPSYLQHIVFHLYGLVQYSNSPGSLRKQASKIITALSNVQLWLEQARALARQLLSMTDAQLLQPGTLALLNDLIEYSTRAYTGQTDPLTGDVHEGVVWIHDFIQTLAMFDITPYAGHSFSIQMIQDTRHPMAVRPLYHEDTL